MILKHPFVTEKASMMLENESKIQFLVQSNATKEQIKRDIEKSFGQKVTKVRTIVTTKNEKKAIVSFENKKAAEEILSRLGIM